MDVRSLGLPDMSYHGTKAWYPEFEDFRRQFGVFYCGEYGEKADKSPDDYFYVAYNMHWEPHEFALPNLPKGLKWHLAFDTEDDGANGYYEAGKEPLLEDQKKRMVLARSIQVLIGKKAVQEEKQETKEKKNDK